jgi:hypothetical protein
MHRIALLYYHIGGRLCELVADAVIQKHFRKMENFEIHLIRFSVDSKTGVISIIVNLAGRKRKKY